MRAALADVLRERGERVELPSPVYGPPQPGDLRSSLLNSNLAGQELGWYPQVKLEEGLKRTAAWFAEHKD